MKGFGFWDNPIITYRGRDGVLYDGPLAVEIGELTGNFTSQLEHVVSFLQRILYKMEVSGHPLSTRPKFDKLRRELLQVRHSFLEEAWAVPAGPMLQHTHCSSIMEKGIQEQMLDTIRELCGIAGNYAVYEDSLKDKYRMWDTFILIFDYFLDNMKKMKKDFEDVEGRAQDATAADLLAKVESSTEVKRKWEKTVELFDNGLPVYTDLLEIILGSLRQNCSECNAAITVEATFGDHPTGSARERRPVAFCQGFLIQFHCGTKKCREATIARHGLVQFRLIMLLTKTLEAHAGFYCDWCKRLQKKVHRCKRCQTKVYCSQACLDMDWELVHKKICSRNPDARKIKPKHRA